MAAALLMPARAWAHAHLKRSDPAAGSQLVGSPQFIRLWFSEQPDLSLTLASLQDAAGRTFRLARVEQETSGRMGIRLRVLDTLPQGHYTLSWRTAGSDGHPSSGKFAFDVGAAAQISGGITPPPRLSPDSIESSRSGALGANGSQASAQPADLDAASSIGNSIARAFLFLALLALIGTVSFNLVVLRRANAVPIELKRSMAQRAAALGAVSALLLLIISLVRLYLESRMMSAMPDMPGMEEMSIREMVMHTGWGFAFQLQVAAAISAVFGFAMASRRLRGGWSLAAISALVLAITPALSGHAAASPRFRSLMILADWLHVLGGAGWLGSLLSVMLIGVPVALTLESADRWASVASLVNAFSSLALICAAVVVASGVFASWVHLEHVTALWETTYGRVLLVKLIFVAITFAVGAYNFKRVQPQLSNQVGTERLRRSAALELTTAFLILLVTGLLTGVST
jgi:putative copper export protein/methionine-rich copper-binding protein CopC